MPDTKYTPEKWTTEHNSHWGWCVREGQKWIAFRLKSPAHAGLISAAPDLAEALQACLKAIDQLMPGIAHIAVQDYENINQAPLMAQAALRKAGLL